MKYFLKERIGNPELFTGRRKELAFFLKWIDEIKEEKSKSTAIMARKKMGKSAILERLFNITFYKNSGVVPFFYEVKEGKKWAIDFFKDFFLTFVYQYIAFITDKSEYLVFTDKDNFEKAKMISEKEGVPYLINSIEGVEHAARNESVDSMWEMARNAPKWIAEQQGKYILQIIDEFQFLNSEIYRDRACTNRMSDLAGAYLNTAESKVAPLLVSGSWVGWLMNDLIMQLPARFKFKFLKNMPEDEAIEMISRYSQFFDVPVSEEITYLLFELTEGSPFYINSIIRSNCEEKDLMGIEGLLKVMEFETLSYEGEIKSTWMEYITTAFYRINDRNAKNIVLYLCKNREREVTRKEILEDLNLDMTDMDLEKRLKALVMADIVERGSTNFDYRGIGDNIFDKVFRGEYQKEIESFDVKEITSEYKSMYLEMQKRYQRLLGQYNYQKGYFAEYVIINKLRLAAFRENEFYKSLSSNLPEGFRFVEYERVWAYRTTPDMARELNIDIFARAKGEGYSLIGEVKNRSTRMFSLAEAEEFLNKMKRLEEIEEIERSVGFVFSRQGFTKEAEEFCRKKGIAYSSDERWVG